MARRKVVFVIVEGASDETALGITLNQVFDKESVHVHIMHGDITTRTGVTSQNIVAKVGKPPEFYLTVISRHQYVPTRYKGFSYFPTLLVAYWDILQIGITAT